MWSEEIAGFILLGNDGSMAMGGPYMSDVEQGRELLEALLPYIQEHITDIQAKNQIFPENSG